MPPLSDARPKPIVHALRTPTGVGKTQHALAKIAELVRSGMRPALAVPTHALGEEAKRQLAELGVRAEVYRGLSATDPEDPDHAMCRRSGDAETVRAGGGRLEQVCRLCEHRSACGYHRQMTLRDEVDVWVVPHNVLVHPVPAHSMRAPDVLVIDECPIDAFLVGLDGEPPSMSAQELRERHKNARGARRAIDGDSLWQRSVIAYFIEVVPLGGRLDEGFNAFLAGLPKLDFHGCDHSQRALYMLAASFEMMDASLAMRAAHLVLKQKEPLPDDCLVAMLEVAARNSRLLLEAQMYEALAAGGHGIRVVASRSKDEVVERRIEIRRRRAIAKDWRVPTLLMDATGDWRLYEQFFDVSKATNVEAAAPHMHVRQILWSGAASKLLSSKEARGNQGRVRRYIESRAAHFGSVLVVAQKAVIEALKVLGLPRNVETTHFNANRGIDHWRDVELVIVIGRTEPPPKSVELAAEVIFQRKVQRLPEGEYYPRSRVGLCERNDEPNTRAVEATCHPDPDVEALRKHYCEEELVQTIGRGRGINRTAENPLQVDIINLVPLPIATDEFLTRDEAQPDPLDVIRGRYGLVLDPSSRYLPSAVAVLLPDAASSRSSVRRARRKNRGSTHHPPIKKINKGGWCVEPLFSRGRFYPPGTSRGVPCIFRESRLRPLLPDEDPPDGAVVIGDNGERHVLEPVGPEDMKGQCGYLLPDEPKKPRGRPAKAEAPR